MILLGAAALASCQAGRSYPALSYPAARAADELAAFSGGAPFPPFYGEGVFEATGAKPMRGVIRLALAEGRYRLELASEEGAALAAYAGDDGRRALSLNPTTGERRMTDSGLSISPYLALVTAVSGRPPPFGRVSAAYRQGELKLAVTENPRMELSYDQHLRDVLFANGGDLRIALGPIAAGPAAPYASGAVFPLAGATLRVQWRRVWQDIVFPPGFFSFEEDPL